MDKEFIDLGYSYDGPIPMGATADEAPRKHFPTLCITSDEPIELPEGEFKFTGIARCIEVNANERDPEDKKFRYELEVTGISPGKPVDSEEGDDAEPAPKGKDPVDELEKAMRGEE